MYTGASALIEALVDAGVSYLFANFGSDHPGIVEAVAQARATGKPAPKVITCPNEMVALTCAQGFAQITGRAQAVLVHVDCGTQAMAGAIHNVAKCRVPVLIFAGASPYPGRRAQAAATSSSTGSARPTREASCAAT
jgi:acetolactate synthase-1/2/3 large subunit